MKKKVVIAGSASLQEKSEFWKRYWEGMGCCVTDCPQPINKENFLEEYPEVYKVFFKNITEADTLFIMNEDRKGIVGYLGAESFAEMCFGVAQNLVYNKKLEIILLQKPGERVQSHEEITLWLKLGWIKLHKA